MNCHVLRKLLIILAMLLLCSACHAQRSLVKPPLVEDGEVFLYLKPMVRDARGVRFTMERIAAVRTDGSEVPLIIAQSELKDEAVTRQRLLASGVLPPGNYSGFSFKSGKGFIRTEKGETPLRVSDKARIIEFSFSVAPRKGTVVSLAFNPGESLTEDTDFAPVFQLTIPARPLAALAGYVTNYGSNNISVFDKRSGEVLDVIETGQGPRDMVLDLVLRRGYVALSGEDTVAVIDLMNDEVINRIVLNPGDKPQGMVLTPDGRTLLAVNTGSNSVSVIDPVGLQETNRIRLGIGPGPILLDPGGVKAYVFHALSNSISVIDIANAAVASTIATESNPLWGQFSRRGDKLFVIHAWSPNLLVYDTLTLGVLKRINVGMGVSGLQVDHATDRFYLARHSDAIIEIYDPYSYMPVDFLQAGSPGASYMLIDRAENNLLMLMPGRKALHAVNLVSKKSAFVMDVGAQPAWATLSSER